jgi:2-octaprenyl-6-methoxyphenol hydroxylase
MPEQKEFEAIVAGAGPAGLAAACLLAQSGCRTACVAPDIDAAATPADEPVRRTVALMQPAIRLLETLDVWPASLKDHCAALKLLKIVDDTLETFSAPPITFSSKELGDDEFGWNIPLPLLISALAEAASKADVTLINANVTGYDNKAGAAHVSLDNGDRLVSRVVVAADGRQSVLRRDAGIATSEWDYDQIALALSFSHSAPHRGQSIEYHKSSGPFTTVPLPGNRSSLVWMVTPKEAEAIRKLQGDALDTRLQLEMHGDLGLITQATSAAKVPMRGMSARKFAANRVFLVGEAAHVVPPIGAQGLNMSLRDAAYAAEIISDAIRLDEDPGSNKLCETYDTMRKADVLPRQAAIDTMNRSLTSQFFPLHLGRAVGMTALKHIPPLRKRAMREGMDPKGSLPRVMRA